MFKKNFLAFGEILWDYFPDGKKLGGAPLNFSYYFNKQGGNSKIISAVGKDKLGGELLQKIKCFGIDLSYIEKINKPTGKVYINMNKQEHSFHIVRKNAWEQIPYPKNLTSIENIEGIYFDSLARISSKNRYVLDKLLNKLSKEIVFLDLNLRQELYNIEDIRNLMFKTTYLKLNEEEAELLRRKGLIKGSNLEERAKYLIKNYGITNCCITLGEKGVIGGDKNNILKIKGIPAKEKGDSVGAGDAFAATWLINLLKKKTMKEALCVANEVGSKVASQRGAIIKI